MASIALLAGACAPTIDDVKQRPVLLELTVPAAWDRVGACIASTYNGDYVPLYLPVFSERRAEVIVQFIVNGAPWTQAVFQIVGGEATKVTWQRVATIAVETMERKARETIERCGRV